MCLFRFNDTDGHHLIVSRFKIAVFNSFFIRMPLGIWTLWTIEVMLAAVEGGQHLGRRVFLIPSNRSLCWCWKRWSFNMLRVLSEWGIGLFKLTYHAFYALNFVVVPSTFAWCSPWRVHKARTFASTTPACWFRISFQRGGLGWNRSNDHLVLLDLGNSSLDQLHMTRFLEFAAIMSNWFSPGINRGSLQSFCYILFPCGSPRVCYSGANLILETLLVDCLRFTALITLLVLSNAVSLYHLIFFCE